MKLLAWIHPVRKYCIRLFPGEGQKEMRAIDRDKFIRLFERILQYFLRVFLQFVYCFNSKVIIEMSLHWKSKLWNFRCFPTTVELEPIEGVENKNRNLNHPTVYPQIYRIKPSNQSRKACFRFEKWSKIRERKRRVEDYGWPGRCVVPGEGG